MSCSIWKALTFYITNRNLTHSIFLNYSAAGGAAEVVEEEKEEEEEMDMGGGMDMFGGEAVEGGGDY